MKRESKKATSSKSAWNSNPLSDELLKGHHKMKIRLWLVFPNEHQVRYSPVYKCEWERVLSIYHRKLEVEISVVND